jgi:hypothetical protein
MATEIKFPTIPEDEFVLYATVRSLFPTPFPPYPLSASSNQCSALRKTLSRRHPRKYPTNSQGPHNERARRPRLRYIARQRRARYIPCVREVHGQEGVRGAYCVPGVSGSYEFGDFSRATEAEDVEAVAAIVDTCTTLKAIGVLSVRVLALMPLLKLLKSRAT